MRLRPPTPPPTPAVPCVIRIIGGVGVAVPIGFEGLLDEVVCEATA